VAQIILNIPDEHIEDAIDAVCYGHHYQADKKFGETRPQFCKRMIATHIKDHVKEYKAEKAYLDSVMTAELVRDAKMKDIENNLNIT